MNVLKKLGDPSFVGAFVDTTNELLIRNQRNTFNFSFISCKEKFASLSVVFYYRKNYFLIKAIDDVLGRLKSGGLIDHVQLTYLDKRFLKPQDTQTGPRKLTFTQLSGPFQIWACGCVFASVCFLIEVFRHASKGYRNHVRCLRANIRSRFDC